MPEPCCLCGPNVDATHVVNDLGPCAQLPTVATTGAPGDLDSTADSAGATPDMGDSEFFALLDSFENSLHRQ